MLIKLVVEMKEPGIYDFWTNFWGKPDTVSDWLISTGLNPTVQFFRQMACRTVDTSEYDSSLLVNIGDSLFLYQAYAGRDTLDSGEVICIFIDDHVLVDFQIIGEEGDVYRTWFDGISYARIETPARVSGTRMGTTPSTSLLQLQYVPFSSQLKVTYSVSRNEKVTIGLYDLQGKKIQSHASFAQYPGTYIETFSTLHLTAGAYLCRLTTGHHSATAMVRVMR